MQLSSLLKRTAALGTALALAVSLAPQAQAAPAAPAVAVAPTTSLQAPLGLLTVVTLDLTGPSSQFFNTSSPVTLTAKVKLLALGNVSIPPLGLGNVRFSIDGRTIKVDGLNSQGEATFTFSPTSSIGVKNIKATFQLLGGVLDPLLYDLTGANDTFAVTVKPNVSTVTALRNKATQRQGSLDTAVITTTVKISNGKVPAGYILFSVNKKGTAKIKLDANGVAKFRLSSKLPVGKVAILADFKPLYPNNYLPAKGSSAVQVIK